MVGGFGRFVKADATTDLRAFRCQIVLDSLLDVPQNLSIVLGDEVFSVMVHLESWERAEDGGGGDPPPPPRNGPAEGEIDEDVPDIIHQQDGMEDQAAVAEEMDAGDGEVEELDAPRQTQQAFSGAVSCRVEQELGGTGRLLGDGCHQNRRWRGALDGGAGRDAIRSLTRDGRHRIEGRGASVTSTGGETGRSGGDARRIWRRRAANGGGADREVGEPTVCGGRRQWHVTDAGGVTLEGGGALATVAAGVLFEGSGAPEPRLAEEKLECCVYLKKEWVKWGWDSRAVSSFSQIGSGEGIGSVFNGGGTQASV